MTPAPSTTRPGWGIVLCALDRQHVVSRRHDVDGRDHDSHPVVVVINGQDDWWAGVVRNVLHDVLDECPLAA